ncbi:MAG: DUF2147 domain-containing protein [Pseudomonadota bacterium]
MRNLLLVLAAVLMLVPVMGATADADDGGALQGTWLVDKKTAKVNIYKCNDKYCGQIVWLKEPNFQDGRPKVDKLNPDDKKKNRKIVGMTMLWNCSYAGGGEYSGGKIYNAENGKDYKCKMKLNGNSLEVRVYGRTPALGKTIVWTR